MDRKPARCGTPWEFAINKDSDFVGKKSLCSNHTGYVYAVTVDGRRKPGEGSRVFLDGDEIGVMTSSIIAVTLGKIPAGYIRVENKFKAGDKVEIINEKGKSFSATIVENPLYKGTARKKMATFLN